MAGRGGNDVTFTSELENYSDAIRHAGEKLFEHLMNRTIQFVNVIGCNGVGRWRIIEYAARKLKGFDLFDVQIEVKIPKGDLNPERVQMEIVEQLKLTGNVNLDGVQTKSIVAAGEIYKSLVKRTFLLIVGDVSGEIKVDLMGIPLPGEAPYDSKVVFVRDEVMPPVAMPQYNVTIDSEELSEDMLLEEASDVAHSPGIQGYFAPETILHCLLFFWFFSGNCYSLKYVTRIWMAEGVIIRRETEEDEEYDSTLVEMACILLREFELRSLIQLTESKTHWQRPDWAMENDRGRDLANALTHGRYRIYLPPKRKLLDTYWPTELPLECHKLSALQLGGWNYFHSDFEIVIPDPFFKQMQGLRVLRLDQLSIKSLPSSIACLHNLRLLSISQCQHLNSLPTSIQALYNLEFLYVEQCSSFETMPDECFRQMTNLQFFKLNGTSIRSLPSSVSKLHTIHQLNLTESPSLMEIPNETFECMERLQVLHLGGAYNLNSLPSSLSKLVNLRQLVLWDCSSLKMKLLPHLQNLSALKELDLEKCNSLEDIEDLSTSLGNILPNLRKLYLSGIEAISQVSLNGCQSLESVSLNQLTNLRKLNISGTKIKCFPEDNMVDTNHLRRLDFQCMNHLQEIKWDDLSTELEYLNIDQCNTGDNKWQGDTVGAHIRVSNYHLLQSLTADSKLWGAKCFSRFHICISPCQEEKRQRRFLYAKIGFKTQIPNLPSESHFDRHLEIRGGDTSPHISTRYLLIRTELFTLCDNAFVHRLSDFCIVDAIAELRECRVESCKNLEKFFEGVNLSSAALSCLENVWMSNLPRLKGVCEGRYASKSFTLLKHIYLERCPRLIVVFSSGVCLTNLETLHIKFCTRLEAVFRGVAKEEGSLQRLHTVCLWELPKLESICSDVCLGALKKLRVGGCPKLNKLPLQISNDNAAASTTVIGGGGVKVEGELVWWASLKLEGDNIKRHVYFKERRPFNRR
ncbi:putative disease resistance protein At4g19050 [Magnolia sinica]|uniref:putative disease resistance protein At4g19050 n=1 Tax=Magnolia sinica TaxID=86752 RepID=UPI00265A96F7|nr:putative disease resistance protein At4g19050 [Magnolia sinica]